MDETIDRIPAPTCQDQLALNFGEPEECVYHESADNSGGGCKSCNGGTPNGNGNGNGTNGFLGFSRSNWMWIILAAIVGYYLWKKNG